jgi:hypothetical protein
LPPRRTVKGNLNSVVMLKERAGLILATERPIARQFPDRNSTSYPPANLPAKHK